MTYFTEPRFTKDLDIWIRPSPENAARVYRALAAFGAPMQELRVEDLEKAGTIFQIGVAPSRIDVLTSIEDVEFEAAWRRKVASRYGDVSMHVLSAEDLLINKRAVARPQDLLDVARLERALQRRE